MKIKKTALVILAKCPVPGKVNTRLQPQISERDSARLQEAFILDTIDKAKSLIEIDVYFGHAPSDDILFLEKVKNKSGVELFLQEGGSLGLKIKNAFSEMFNRKYRKIIIIGVDSPTFPPACLRDAAASLDENNVVFGPTVDGGYYLVGMKEENYPLFPDTELGTKDVLSEALKACVRLNLKISSLPPWYDMDRYSDLEFAHTHVRLLSKTGKYFPERTKKILEELFAS